tara:strand:- start:466 stop:582 length:117 start_codon:yes stop_codon:yes gene_type:complete
MIQIAIPNENNAVEPQPSKTDPKAQFEKIKNPGTPCII